MFVPPIVASLLIASYANLEKLKHSPFGNYVRASMTTAMEIVRLAGFAIMIAGAWYHPVTSIVAGLFVILFGWMRGMIAKK